MTLLRFSLELLCDLLCQRGIFWRCCFWHLCLGRFWHRFWHLCRLGRFWLLCRLGRLGQTGAAPSMAGTWLEAPVPSLRHKLRRGHPQSLPHCSLLAAAAAAVLLCRRLGRRRRWHWHLQATRSHRHAHAHERAHRCQRWAHQRWPHHRHRRHAKRKQCRWRWNPDLPKDSFLI